MTLLEELEQAATVAATHANGGGLTGVLATEPAGGRRIYVCAFESPEGSRAWIALDGEHEVVTARRDVRDAVSIAALCEVAEEAAFPGDLDELRGQLVALRLTEDPDGVAEAEEAALALQHTLGSPPHLSSPARLDEIGVAARRLEVALDPTAPSPFTTAMRSAADVADALWDDVAAAYLGPLE